MLLTVAPVESDVRHDTSAGTDDRAVCRAISSIVVSLMSNARLRAAKRVPRVEPSPPLDVASLHDDMHSIARMHRTWRVSNHC